MRRLRITTRRGALKLADDLAQPHPKEWLDREYWRVDARGLLGAYFCLAGIDRRCGRPQQVTMSSVHRWVEARALLDDPVIADLISIGMAGDAEAASMATYAAYRLQAVAGCSERVVDAKFFAVAWPLGLADDYGWDLRPRLVEASS